MQRRRRLSFVAAAAAWTLIAAAASSGGRGSFLTSCNAFVPSSGLAPSQTHFALRSRRTPIPSSRISRHMAAKNNDEEIDDDDDDGSGENIPSDASLFSSLQSRLAEIKTDRNAVIKRWRKGKCSSSIRLSLDDWVRRIDMAQWPLAVLGSASGHIYLADLSLKISLVKFEDVHDAQGGDEDMLELLFGQYDGGGTIAVAVGGPNGRFAVTAGREGGAVAWRIGGGGNGGTGKDAADIGGEEDVDGIGGIGSATAPSPPSGGRGQEVMECLGELSPLAGAAVTCLKLDGEGRLWAGCYDGSVHCIHISNLVQGKDPKLRKFKCDSAVLSIDIGEDIDLVAVGMSSGSVDLFSADEELDESKGRLRKIGHWTPREDTPARSVAVAPFPISLCGYGEDANSNSERDYESEEEFAWSLVSGGNDGCLHAIPLNIDCDSDVVDEDLPLGDSVEEDTVALQPPHNGPVTSISWRKGGIIVSGAQDGTIRVWDSTPRCASDASINQGVAKVAYDPRCLYGLGGYKVWLGSVNTGGDGLRLISDGSDNSIIVHNFSPDGDADGQDLQDDDGSDSDDGDGSDDGSFGSGGNSDFDDEAAFM